jgi:hypothetical protein
MIEVCIYKYTILKQRAEVHDPIAIPARMTTAMLRTLKRRSAHLVRHCV